MLTFGSVVVVAACLVLVYEGVGFVLDRLLSRADEDTSAESYERARLELAARMERKS